MRLALPLTIVVLVFAGLAAGCGGGSSSTDTGSGGGAASSAAPQSAPPGASSHECGGQELRVTGVACDKARAVLAAWRAAPGCRFQGGESHASCKVQTYLCIAARQGQEAAVSCSRPGHSILFVPQD
jgi:hypothetical protein